MLRQITTMARYGQVSDGTAMPLPSFLAESEDVQKALERILQHDGEVEKMYLDAMSISD